MSAEGARQNSVLDHRITNREEVSSILNESAELIRKDSHDRMKAQAAATLYMLAGAYASLLILLNELISPPDRDDEDRK